MTTTNNTMMINLTDAQLDQIAQLRETRSGRSIDSIVAQALAHGLNNLAYRTERNKKVYAERKAEMGELEAMRAELKALRSTEQKIIVVKN